MKKSSILYPFQICKDNFQSYAVAIELAKKLNYNLTLLVNYSDPNLRMNTSGHNKKTGDRIKEKIYCYLLEMNGVYQGSNNQWKALDKVKIETLIKEGPVENVLLSSLSRKNNSLLLLAAEMISNKTISTLAMKKLSTKITHLWVLPKNYQFFKPNPNSPPEFFERQKKNLINELLWNTKHYMLPDDLNIYYKDYSIQTKKKISLNNSFTDSIFC